MHSHDNETFVMADLFLFECHTDFLYLHLHAVPARTNILGFIWLLYYFENK